METDTDSAEWVETGDQGILRIPDTYAVVNGLELRKGDRIEHEKYGILEITGFEQTQSGGTQHPEALVRSIMENPPVDSGEIPDRLSLEEGAVGSLADALADGSATVVDQSEREILQIVNKHGESCGQPPRLNFGEFDTVSYFENKYGEQAIFLFDRDELEMTVYMGDAGWDDPQTIPVGELEKFPETEVDEIVGWNLAPDERAWLGNCLNNVSNQF